MRYFFLGLIALTLGAQAASAQAVSTAQQAILRAELSQRGLTEREARDGLAKAGLDLDTIPVAQLPALQARIVEVLDRVADEKRRSAVSVAPRPPASDSGVVVLLPPPPARADLGSDGAPRGASGAASAPVKVDSMSIYGHDLFANRSLQLNRSTDGSMASDAYVLGAGDVIRVSIFGAFPAEFLLEIDPEGYVTPTGIPRVYLQGISLVSARELLRDRFDDFYSIGPDQFVVTVRTARAVTVNVFGEVRSPGAYSMSALNSTLNALMEAGGPTGIGSVRSIEVSRGSARRTIDLYDFLRDPQRLFTLDLQHNDVIFVPVARAVVRVAGAVKRPQRYELREGEGLRELIGFAGGVNFDTYTEIVQVERIEGDSVVLREWPLSAVLNGATTVPVRDGDVVRIREIGRPLTQVVEIDGAVVYAGRYDIASSPTLGALLAKAELRPQAKSDVIYIERIGDDGSLRLVPVTLAAGLSGADTVALRRGDKVIVFSQARYAEAASFSVTGSVRDGFERSLALGDRIKLAEAIELAGGLTPTAAASGYVVRTDPFAPSRVEYIRVTWSTDAAMPVGAGDRIQVLDQRTYTDLAGFSVRGSVRAGFEREFAFGDRIKLGDAIELAGGLRPTASQVGYIFRRSLTDPERVDHIRVDFTRDAAMPVGPGDRVVAYDQRTYSDIGELSIGGAVREPLGTRFDPTVSVGDLVTMAGGLLQRAATSRVDVFRLRIDERKGTTFDRIQLSIDTLYRVVSAPPDFRLQPFDQVIVRAIPLFNVSRNVQVTGAVLYPGTYALPTERVFLSDVIQEAGGLSALADPRGAVIVRAATGGTEITVDLARALSQRRDLTADPVLLEGDVVRIEPRQNTFQIRLRATRLGELQGRGLAVIADSGNSDVRTQTFVYEGKRSAKWYLNRFAGGFSREADKLSVTVTDPAGRVQATRRVFIFFKDYPDVEAGSSIAVAPKPPKLPSEEKGVDWDAIYNRTFQGVTTLLSLAILLTRL